MKNKIKQSQLKDRQEGPIIEGSVLYRLLEMIAKRVAERIANRVTGSAASTAPDTQL